MYKISDTQLEDSWLHKTRCSWYFIVKYFSFSFLAKNGGSFMSLYFFGWKRKFSFWIFLFYGQKNKIHFRSASNWILAWAWLYSMDDITVATMLTSALDRTTMLLLLFNKLTLPQHGTAAIHRRRQLMKSSVPECQWSSHSEGISNTNIWRLPSKFNYPQQQRWLQVSSMSAGGDQLVSG